MLRGVRPKRWVECKAVGGNAVICQVWIQQANVVEGCSFGQNSADR